ncbi:MAG: hypothetical protein HY619_06665 [Thaumarchaeota archaeon]|nr:hypothetical protein [Nitrososphaerota archaeon]
MSTCEYWIAIPDSILADTPSLREKTVKIGTIARTAAIFNVTQIYLYHHLHNAQPQDSKLIHELLEYLDTPQYLRKRLYPMKKEFTYAGLLPPLRTPAHTVPIKPEAVKTGDYRQGIVLSTKNGLRIDVGLPSPLPFQGRAKEGERVTVQITSTLSTLQCKVSDDLPPQYWGYKVFTTASITSLLKETKPNMVILTSRKGQSIASMWSTLLKTLTPAPTILLVLGSTRKGIFEIMQEEHIEPQAKQFMTLNTFPRQGTATIRVEEALLGSLAILNVASQLSKTKAP